jgi:hypothetical protein
VETFATGFGDASTGFGEAASPRNTEARRSGAIFGIATATAARTAQRTTMRMMDDGKGSVSG